MHVNMLERLMKQLRDWGVGFALKDDGVVVPKKSDSGFTLKLEATEAGFVVHYDGWSETFTCEMQAMDCLVFGLSDKCRLKVFTREGEAYRWTVEYFADGQWLERSTVGLCSFPLWQERSIEYKQNAERARVGTGE